MLGLNGLSFAVVIGAGTRAANFSGTRSFSVNRVSMFGRITDRGVARSASGRAVTARGVRADMMAGRWPELTGTSSCSTV